GPEVLGPRALRPCPSRGPSRFPRCVTWAGTARPERCRPSPEWPLRGVRDPAPCHRWERGQMRHRRFACRPGGRRTDMVLPLIIVESEMPMSTKSHPRPTPAQREELGKMAREAAPVGQNAQFRPSAERADPVAILEEQARTRVPELVPVRYGRMLVSPFTFFRGAAAGMAADLAGTPDSGLTVQLCGDAHLSNFGMFASPDR